MPEELKLTEKQIRKVDSIINDNRARYMEFYSSEEINKAIREGNILMPKVFQEDRQVIGELTVKQAYIVRVFCL